MSRFAICDNQEVGNMMTYETKVILRLLADSVARSKNLKQAYGYIARAANVEGLELPDYETVKAAIEQEEAEYSSLN